MSDDYVKIYNCYNLEEIKNDSSVYLTGGIVGNHEVYNGSAINYLRKIVGNNLAGSSNVTDVGALSNMPTVYNVINGLSDSSSQYWSKSDLNSPKLLWEK